MSNPYRSTSDPTYGVTTTAYDGLSRPVSVTKPDGSIVQTQYCGSATLVIDEAGHWRRSITDGLGRLIEVDEPSSSSSASGACAGSGGAVNKTTYAYDALGDLTSVVQSGSRNRSFVYDSLKRLTSSTNPESGTVTYTYDADGNVATKTDARSLTITYSYDALNRLMGRTYSNSDPSVTYTYDQTACLGLAACYNIGRRTTMTDAGGSESLAYDQMGRELTHLRTTNSVTKTTSYTYNLNGTLATLTYPSGRTITYGYNVAAQPVSAADTANSITYATGAIYGPQGALAQVQNGTNLVSTFIFNARLQPCWMYATTGAALATSTTCTATDSTPGNILDLHYNFNLGSGDNGNVMGITNNRDTTRTQSFTYDQLNRIADAQTSSTTGANCWGETYTLDQWANLTAIGAASGYTGCTQESLSVSVGTNNQLTSTGISYDRFGNRWNQTVTAGSGPAPGYGFDANNHVVSGSGVTYDAAGESTDDGTTTYTFDAEGRIITTSNGTSGASSYVYDAEGRRVRKTTVAGGTVDFLYDLAGHEVSQISSTGTWTRGEVYATGRHVATYIGGTGGTTYFNHADWLGTERARSNVSGALCESITSLAYGDAMTTSGSCGDPSPMHFTGKERDSESGNDYFGARYYNSAMGRFLSPDWSAKVTPVPYAKLSDPQSLNLYAYVGNNPMTRFDPDGHFDCTGKNAQGAGCQYIANWNKEHGIDPSAKKSNAPGVPVKLPNGKTVPDPHSPTGVMMAPSSSVSDVAAAGKNTGKTVAALNAAGMPGTAAVVLVTSLGTNVGTGGTFDEQRMGPQSDVLTGGFQQLPQFRDASNFNVGLFSQQAGMTLDQTLQTAGDFAKHFSSDYSPDQPYGLAPQTAEFITAGYRAGANSF